MAGHNYIKVFAPATVANVTCGFDVFGLAVEAPGDIVELKRISKPGVTITEITGDDGRLPREAHLNSASVTILQYLKALGIKDGVEMVLHKQMPLGSGLGSSAASSVAGVFAANVLFGSPLQPEALLAFAMEGERIACGSAHADNVAPCLLGGFVLIRSYEPLDAVKLPTPAGWYCAVVHPHIEVNTKDARNILRKQVSLSEGVRQWGNVGGFIAGWLMQDVALLKRSMEDHIVEPLRSMLIPGFDLVKASALAQGAIGCGISGSGPSIFALCETEAIAQKAGVAMSAAFHETGIQSDVFVSPINAKGPQVLELK
jgi:homoserine kinase